MRIFGVRFHHMKLSTVKTAIDARTTHAAGCPNDPGRVTVIYGRGWLLIRDRDGHDCGEH